MAEDKIQVPNEWVVVDQNGKRVPVSAGDQIFWPPDGLIVRPAKEPQGDDDES